MVRCATGIITSLRARQSRRLALDLAGFLAMVFPSTMIATETLNIIENIKKRAGHLWRFL
jgi:hypothetical protein